MKISLSLYEAFLVFVFTASGFPEVRGLGLSPQMVPGSGAALSTGNFKVPSLATMFIFTSFVNLIGQMVCNYFNCIDPSLVLWEISPSVCLLIAFPFVTSWSMTPTPFLPEAFCCEINPLSAYLPQLPFLYPFILKSWLWF